MLAAALVLPLLLAAEPARPNIVLLVGDDTGPQLGCYGDARARTPHLDRLAGEGVRFAHAFACPVCAPSRSALVTGRHPDRLGTMHMRSRLTRAPATLLAPLRAAGYRVYWPGKTDFNFRLPEGGVDSTAAWHLGAEALREPFLAYANLAQTHEGRLQMDAAEYAQFTALLPPELRQPRSPEGVPPYLPDDPRVREAVARQHELTSLLDAEVGAILDRLERDGLAQRTLVLFIGDNGPGLPRGKRWTWDSGTRVPLIARWPGALPAGTVRTAPVAIWDVLPSVLAAAGVPLPEGLDGVPFLGAAAPEREAVVLHRDRMDETHDRIRCVREARFAYVRNLLPDLPYAQRIRTPWRTPAMQAWLEAHGEGRLDAVQAAFFAPRKPAEELYDCVADPHQIENLAGRPEHAATLARLRARLDAWLAEAPDLGAVDERALIAQGMVEDLLSTYAERLLPGGG